MTWVREHQYDLSDPVDRDQWASAMRRSGIPARFWDARTDMVKGVGTWVQQALARTDFWAEKGCGFFVHGPFNTGKSAAAAILARDFVNRCHVVVWLSVRDVPAVRFRSTPEASEVDDRLRTADLLVLDDLGSERFRLEGAGGAALEEVVRIMYERKRPVVFTSNKSWEHFQAAYSPALVSVVKRIAYPAILLDPWDDVPPLGSVTG